MDGSGDTAAPVCALSGFAEGCDDLFMKDYAKRAEQIRSCPDPAIWLEPSRYWKGGGKPQYAQFDFETYSDVDIGKGGAYKYIRSEAFEPLILAVAFDDEDVFCIDLASGDEVPDIVWAAVFDDEIIKTAWNAQFERGIFGRMAGHVLSPNAWRCTMVWAASLSLPLKLKNAAKVLKTGEQKDRSGEALIRKFSVPRTPTPNDPRTRVMPSDDPEGWRQFKDYCLQDVRTERDIRKRLETFPLPDREWDVYRLDQRINDRGVLVDMDLVEKAIESRQNAVHSSGQPKPPVSGWPVHDPHP